MNTISSTNFTSALEHTTDELFSLVSHALRLKERSLYPDLKNSLLGLVFFNTSLRTRLSFEAAMARCGGQALNINPGENSWGLETELGVTMDGDKPEHIKEAAQVISRYVDCIGVRSFAEMNSLEEDGKEPILSSFKEYATVPVINLESAMEHPCQMIADMATLSEKLSDPRGKTLTLQWAPHVKPLPLAVPHSIALGAATLGMNVTIAAPEGYDLHPRYEKEIASRCESNGARYNKRHTKDDNSSSDVLYVKSWGAPSLYGDIETQKLSFKENSEWMVKESDLHPSQIFMHCLPVRRNIVVSDQVLDSDQSVVIDQAENRLWAQLAILEKLLGEKEND